MIPSWCYSNLTPSGSLSRLYSIAIGFTDSYKHSIPAELFNWCRTNFKTPQEFNVNRQLILIKTATLEGLNE